MSSDLRQILWTFSIWLESVAILPQLFMLQRTGEADTITTHYLFALGLYRALYIPNWIYRYFTENYFHAIPVIAGIIQTVLYSDFFYIYYTKYVNPRCFALEPHLPYSIVMKGKKFSLPVWNNSGSRCSGKVSQCRHLWLEANLFIRVLGLEGILCVALL